jgi:hypothetical protein
MRSLALLLVALAFSLVAAGRASASNPPSIFLPGASAPRVKALALDTALVKGWTLVESSTNTILFETSLDQPASDGPPGVTPPSTTQLLIRTDFKQIETGTLVSASAEEHWWPGTERAWSDNVTQRYNDNLQRALRSLQQRWERFAGTAKPSTIPPPTESNRTTAPLDTNALPVAPPAERSRPRVAPSSIAVPSSAPLLNASPVPVEPDLDAALVGLWAYYAERHARAAGCDLHDRGATLVSSSGQQELHRVFCTNRDPVMVRCDNQGCRASR